MRMSSTGETLRMSFLRVGKPWEIDPTRLSLRAYNGTPEDLAAFTEVRNETLRATTLPEDYAEATPADIEEQYRWGDFSLEGNAWLMFHESRSVAAAVVYPMAAFQGRPPGNFHLYVVPALWRHGIGARLLAHLEQAAAQRGHPVLETTVAREDARSTRFLLGRGFRIVGHSVRLARASLDELPPVKLPDGYAVSTLAELQEPPELYLETANRLGAYDPNYSLIRAEEMEGQVASGAFDAAGAFFLLDERERIVGVLRASRTGEQRGYLNEIRLEPSSRGKGLGSSMVVAALAYLASVGVQRVELDTPGENAAAHGLALRAGFEEVRHWLHFLKPIGGGGTAQEVGPIRQEERG